MLLVDDDEVLRRSFALRLRKVMGCEVTEVGSADEGRRQLDAGTFDVVLTDFQMSGRTGIWLLTVAKARRPETRRVLMSAGDVPNLGACVADRTVEFFLDKASAGIEAALREALGLI